MDVSAEALSELKLVRPSVPPPPPVRAERASRTSLQTRASARSEDGGRFSSCLSARLSALPSRSDPPPPDERFSQALTSSLDRKGVLAKLKAQLRAHVFEAVRQRDDGADDDGRAFSRTPEGALMTELVSEYLECLGLEYSKRVFDAESGAEELASRRDRAALARDMGVAPPRDEATPLLAAALGEGARGEPKAVGAAPKPPSPPSPHRDQAPVAGNIIVSDDSDSADIETDVDIDYSDAGTSN